MPIAKVLSEMAARYSNGSPGLELPQFQGLATTFGPYADLLAAYQNGDAKGANAKDLEALAAVLDAAAKDPVADRSQRSGQALFARGSRPQDKMRRLWPRCGRDYHSRICWFVFRNRLSWPASNDDINELTPVQDVILGTDVEGKGNTQAQVRASLVPSADRGSGASSTERQHFDQNGRLSRHRDGIQPRDHFA